MNILFTNYCINTGTGTEMFLYDLCEELTRLGHQCAVYTPRQGPLANRFRTARISVVDHFSALAWIPDVLHCHHSMEALEAISYFKTIPALYLCHDSSVWFDQSPPASCLERFLAISTFVQARVMRDSGLPAHQIGLAFNAVNMSRFPNQPRSRLQNRPRKALIFHSHLTCSTYKDKIRQACSELGIKLDEAGHGGSKKIEAPEVELPGYDLVFATGRCAIEAMACGCATILAGGEGLGSLVTTDNFASFKKENFGRSLLTNKLGSDWITSQVTKICTKDVVNVALLVRDCSSLERLVEYMLSEYKLILEKGSQGSLAQRQAIAHTLQIQKQTLVQLSQTKPRWTKSDKMRTAISSFKAYLKNR